MAQLQSHEPVSSNDFWSLVIFPLRMRTDLLQLPPLDLVRGFVAVGRRLSISQAAADLCVTQSAVSKQIRALEDYLGVRLLVRKHRALALTEEGERFFRRMDICFHQLVEATASVRSITEQRPVTITATIGVTSLWLLPRLGRFQQQHPAIDVRVAANNNVLDLEAEGIDLAIRYCAPDVAPAGATRLFGEVIAPVAHPSLQGPVIDTPEQLAKFVLLEYYDVRLPPWLQWDDWLREVGLAGARPKSTLRFNQYDQAVLAAIAGQGIALGRMALIKPMLDDKRLAVVQMHKQSRVTEYAYWLIRKNQSPHAAVEQFAAWIMAEAAQISAELGLP